VFHFRIGFILFIAASLQTSELHAQALSCFGQRFTEINLPQFTENIPNQVAGTCYSYAATAGVEAALYRQTGDRPYLPKMLAAISCEAPNDLNELARESEWLYRGRNGNNNRYFSGSNTYKAAQRLLSHGTVKPTLEPEDTKAIRELIASVNETINLESFSELEVSRRETRNQFVEQTNRAEELKKISSQLTPELTNQINRIFKTLNIATRMPLAQVSQNIPHRIIEGAAAHSRAAQEKKIDLENREQQLLYAMRLLHNIKSCYSDSQGGVCPHLATEEEKIYDLSLLELSKEKKWHGPPSTKACSAEQNKQIIDDIVEDLCLGVPSTVSLTMRHSLRNNNDNEPKPYTSPTSEHDRHAMVLDGVKMINNEPHFTFRNSWGDQKRGEIFLPLKNACAIYSKFNSHLKVSRPNEPLAEKDFRDPKTSTDTKQAIFKSRKKEGLIVTSSPPSFHSEGSPVTHGKNKITNRIRQTVNTDADIAD
jgi:hypothetical protein